MKTPEEYLQEQILLPEHEVQEDIRSYEADFLASLLKQGQLSEPESESEPEKACGSALDTAAAGDGDSDQNEPDQNEPEPDRSRPFTQGHDRPSGLESEKGVQGRHQFVGCHLCGQEYALPLREVQEVLRRIEPTRLPNHPPYLAGVISLRNCLVPLLCLGQLLEKAGSEHRVPQFIIVCRYRDTQFGLLVDRITTMYTFLDHDVEWSIDAQLGGESGFLSGLIKDQTQLVGIVSVQRIAEQVLVSLEQ